VESERFVDCCDQARGQDTDAIADAFDSDRSNLFGLR